MKFNALFEGIVKAETFRELSQIDGSSHSSKDMCALLSNLTDNFVAANVPISHRWCVTRDCRVSACHLFIVAWLCAALCRAIVL